MKTEQKTNIGYMRLLSAIVLVAAAFLCSCASTNPMTVTLDRQLDSILAMPRGPERDRLGRLHDKALAKVKADYEARQMGMAMMAMSRPAPTTIIVQQQQQQVIAPRNDPMPLFQPVYDWNPVGSSSNPVHVTIKRETTHYQTLD